MRKLVQLNNKLTRPNQCIPPPMHRISISMPILTPERNLKHRNPLPPFHPPDSFPSLLQRARLLDMNLKMSRKRKFLNRIRPIADIPNRLQSFP